MAKKIILSCLVAITLCASLFFASCQRGSRNTSNYNDQDNRNNRSDDDSPSRPRDISDNTRKGGGDCAGSEECKDWCDDIFSGRDRIACEELTYNEVEFLYEMLEEDNGILVEPDLNTSSRSKRKSLRDILPVDMYNLFSINEEKEWVKKIKDYGRSETEDILLWLAEEVEIFNTLEEAGEDEKEKILTTILKQTDEKDISDQLLYILDENKEDIFMNIAHAKDNQEAYEYVHEELLIEQCKKPAYDRITGRDASDWKKVACALGEFYCLKDKDSYIIDDDLFSDIVNFDRDLRRYIEDGNGSDTMTGGGRGTGLGVDDETDQREVCERMCGREGKWKQVSPTNSPRPSCWKSH